MTLNSQPPKVDSKDSSEDMSDKGPLLDPFLSLARFKTFRRGPNNLPSIPTMLIGREKELAQTRALILRDDVRLLTLTGPGGTGKTRLGVDLAHSLIDDFTGGVFFISLASTYDPGLFLTRIANTLGLVESGGQPLMEKLKDFMKDKQVLLLLDNFEQIMEAATNVADLLLACSKLKVLVTSREALRIRAEHEYPVSPLSLPDPKHLYSVDSLLKCASIQLLVNRAQAVKPDFALDTKNSWTLAKICTELEGLPLALELAAARIRILSPEEILGRLENKLALLVAGQRDLPARQQTLRDTIEWSYDLLETEEKDLFRQLSVFEGGFSLEAAAICDVGPDQEILEIISHLAEKNLMLREKTAALPRFRMLETIRDFAMESLNNSGEFEEISRRHAGYFLSIAELGEKEVAGPAQAIWSATYEREHDNLLAALHWALENKQSDIALRLVCALWRFWYIGGNLTEGRMWLTRTLAQPFSELVSLRARALMAAGALACLQNDYAAGRQLSEESVTLAQKIGEKEVEAFALNSLGIAARNQGDFVEGRRLHERSLALFRELKNTWGTALVLNSLGVSARGEGSFAQAKTLHEQSLLLFRQVRDKRNVARALINLGMIMEREQKYDQARELLEESLSLFQGQGEKIGTTEALFFMGSVALRQGNYADACKQLAQCLIFARELGYKEIIASSFEEFATYACKQGHTLVASQLLGTAEAIRENIGLPIPPAYIKDHEQCLATIRSLLSEKEFSEEWARGRAMPIEQAVDCALSLQSTTTQNKPD